MLLHAAGRGDLLVDNIADDYQVGGDHYKTLAVEPWRAMAAWMTPEEFRGFLKGNVIKYLARQKGEDDHQKALHYLQKLVELEGRQSEDSSTKRRNSDGRNVGLLDKLTAECGECQGMPSMWKQDLGNLS